MYFIQRFVLIVELRKTKRNFIGGGLYVSLIEINDHCNLNCPICYAQSGTARMQYRSMPEIEKMVQAVVRNEGHPDVVQISGGEPTLHPEFFAVLDLCKSQPIRHLMVNTNGIRIAQDREFAQRLAGYMPDFEVYLQFDSFEKYAHMELRGADLREIRRRALEYLNEFGISTTLVVTLKKGLNDGEIGKVGYEINFNRYFYKYTPPRPLEAIEADIKTVEKDVLDMLREVAG